MLPEEEVIARLRALEADGIWADELAILAVSCFLQRALLIVDEARELSGLALPPVASGGGLRPAAHSLVEPCRTLPRV
eukprot:3281461-Amphidinium_carterae.2